MNIEELRRLAAADQVAARLYDSWERNADTIMAMLPVLLQSLQSMTHEMRVGVLGNGYEFIRAMEEVFITMEKGIHVDEDLEKVLKRIGLQECTRTRRYARGCDEV